MINNHKYLESLKTLNSRIGFNKKFGNFNLYNWIDKKFEIKKNENILDLGCGDGRYSELFYYKIGKKGKLICVDKNLELIRNLKKKFILKNKANIKVIRRNYDTIKWGKKKYIDWFFSIYSIQYTKNIKRLLFNISKILHPHSKIVIIGPGKKNSLEINDIHRKVFGHLPAKAFMNKMRFIENEVYYELIKKFKNKKINLSRHNYKITFPNIMSYAQYYWSTPVWTEKVYTKSSKYIKNKKIKTLEVITNKKLILNKQTICIYCH